MIVIPPTRAYQLGETLPPIGQPVHSWPWGGTPNLTKWALDMLHYNLGTIIYDIVDGYPVVAQIQTHYSYGAHPDWPQKAHKGTSIYVPLTTEASGKTVAMAQPPAGWGDPNAVAAPIVISGVPEGTGNFG